MEGIEEGASNSSAVMAGLDPCHPSCAARRCAQPIHEFVTVAGNSAKRLSSSQFAWDNSLSEVSSLYAPLASALLRQDRATQENDGRDVELYFVYILASKRNGTLYIGVTNNLSRRVREHREGTAIGFTKKYGVTILVYYEAFEEISAAIQRETRLKKRKRL